MNKILFILIILSPFLSNSQEYKSNLDSLLSDHSTEGFGIASLISKNGIIEYKQAFGHANIGDQILLDPNHQFQIGSITKQFTAVLILKLEEHDKINLSDSIQKFIPEFPNKQQIITIEHLLTHTSGIPDYMDWEKHHDKWNQSYSPNSLMELIRNEPLKFTPGDAFEYSNSNYLLLGILIERVTGMSYSDFLHQEIIDKIGMSDTNAGTDLPQNKRLALGYTRTNDQIERSDFEHRSWAFATGNIISTLVDLNCWYSNLFDAKIISSSSLQKALTGYVLNDGEISPYGYGWYIENFQGQRRVYHGGSMSGFYSNISFVPESKTLTITLSNCECIPIDYIARKTTGYAIGKPLLERTTVKIAPEILHTYTGSYKVDKHRKFIVKRKGNHLYGFFVEMPDEGYNLYATPKGTFFSHEINYEFEFILKKWRRTRLKIIIPQQNKKDLIRLLKKQRDRNKSLRS